MTTREDAKKLELEYWRRRIDYKIHITEENHRQRLKSYDPWMWYLPRASLAVTVLAFRFASTTNIFSAAAGALFSWNLPQKVKDLKDTSRNLEGLRCDLAALGLSDGSRGVEALKAICVKKANFGSTLPSYEGYLPESQKKLFRENVKLIRKQEEQNDSSFSPRAIKDVNPQLEDKINEWKSGHYQCASFYDRYISTSSGIAVGLLSPFAPQIVSKLPPYLKWPIAGIVAITPMASEFLCTKHLELASEFEKLQGIADIDFLFTPVDQHEIIVKDAQRTVEALEGSCPLYLTLFWDFYGRPSYLKNRERAKQRRRDQMKDLGTTKDSGEGLTPS